MSGPPEILLWAVVFVILGPPALGIAFFTAKMLFKGTIRFIDKVTP